MPASLPQPPHLRALLVIIPFLGWAAAALVRAQTVSEFPIPTGVTNPFSITSGSDGNLWFTESNANNIGRITPAGTITEYSLNAASTYIAAEPNAIWFTTNGIGKVDLTKTSGCETNSSQCITVYPGVFGQGIAFTPDGGLWLNQGNGVARADKSNPSPATTVVYPTVEHVTTTYGVTKGDDGNIWFIELDHYNSNPDHTGRIAKIDLGKLSTCNTHPANCITEYPVPGGESAVGTSLTLGPDRRIWSRGVDKVNAIDTDGHIQQYAAPGGPSAAIANGTDGQTLWYTGSRSIGRITTAGVVGASISVSADRLSGISAGPDHNMWFCEESTANAIGRINLTGGPAQTPTPTPVVTPPPHLPRGRVTPMAAPTPKTNVPGRP